MLKDHLIPTRTVTEEALVTSALWCHSHVTSSVRYPVDSPSALSYRLPIGKNSLSPTVFQIFRLKYYHSMMSPLMSCRLD